MFPRLQYLVDNAFAGVEAVRRWSAFWGPTVVTPAMVAPFLTIAAILALAISTGILLASLATLIGALLMLYLLLTEVFGFSVEVALA